MPRDKVQFETNIPLTIALKYATGKRYDSDYGEYQMLYSTTDGRVFYASPLLDQQIQALDPKAGEPIVVNKKEVKNASGRGNHTEWLVERAGQRDANPSRPAVEQTTTPLQRTNPIPPTKWPIDRAMSMFLLVAGRATREAESILGTEGGSVRFDSRDVAALATSMFIHSSQAGYLTWVTPQTAQSYVAELKINELAKSEHAATQALQAPEKKPQGVALPSMWRTRGEMKAAFAQLRELVGETVYFAELETAKVASPDQFRDVAAATALYDRLSAIARKEAA